MPLKTAQTLLGRTCSAGDFAAELAEAERGFETGYFAARYNKINHL
jgi:hypothetical protein